MKNGFIFMISISLLLAAGITMAELANYENFERVKPSQSVLVISLVTNFILGAAGMFLLLRDKK